MNSRLTIKALLGSCIKGPFRRTRLAAILLGACIGAPVGTILLNTAGRERQSWPVVATGMIVGMVIGAAFALSLVPRQSQK